MSRWNPNETRMEVVLRSGMEATLYPRAVQVTPRLRSITEVSDGNVGVMAHWTPDRPLPVGVHVEGDWCYVVSGITYAFRVSWRGQLQVPVEGGWEDRDSTRGVDYRYPEEAR